MKKNYMKLLGLCLALCLSGMGVCTSCTQTESPGATVIFPQEKQPGKAQLTVQNGEFTLSNDLLTAKFVTQDGKLMFAGACFICLISKSCPEKSSSYYQIIILHPIT